MPYSAIRSTSTDPRVVLYAEDEPDEILFFKRAAARIKCRLDLNFVANGVDAIRWLAGEEPYNDRTRFPMPHVLVTDLKMPLRSGLDVLVWIRSQPLLKNLPVIMYSNSILPEDKSVAYRLGANKFIAKNVHCNELLATLAQCLDCRLLEQTCFSRCPGSHPSAHLIS